MLDYPKLYEFAEQRHWDYIDAKPYPNTVVDNFLPESIAQAMLKAVPRPDSSPRWGFYFAEGFEDKWALCSDIDLPAPIRSVVHEMNSGPFLTFLEKLTGIKKLLPDPHLHGGGIHLVKRGGVLQIHSDFNFAEHLAAHRRVNMFLYLNENWQEAWGGALELWDTECKNAVASIAPLFNRLVVFSSRSDTFHGHPAPLTCPDGVFRQSLAMYYYTAERPEEEIRAPHNTLYKGMHF